MSEPHEFSDGQKALIEQTAFAVGKKIAAEMTESMRSAIRLHQTECALAKSKAILGGIVRTILLIGSALGVVILALVELLKK